MSIVEGLSGRELMTLEGVAHSFGLSGILLVCLSPLVIGFIVTIAVRYIKKNNKYKREQKEIVDKQKELEKEKSNNKIKHDIAALHNTEMVKADKAESLTLSFDKNGSVKGDKQGAKRGNRKT